MGCSAKAIANHFLDLAREHKTHLSPLKIQKLVYIAHGWHLALSGEPLVDDEYAEAWEYGPVFPSIYHEFKHFGREEITIYATDLDFNDVNEIHTYRPQFDLNDTKASQLLDKVWEVYADESAIQLSNRTHAPGSPWEDTRVGKVKNLNIENGIIKKYYQDLRAKNLAAKNER